MRKMSTKIKVNFRSIITYILFAICLLGCNTVYSTSATTDYRFPELTAILLLLLVVMNIKRLSVKVIKKWSLVFIPYYLWNLIIIFCSVSSDKVISYVVKFLVFVPFLALIILNDAKTKKKNIWKIALKFENVVYVYAIITLIMWTLVCILKISSNRRNSCRLGRRKKISSVFRSAYNTSNAGVYGNCLDEKSGLFCRRTDV